MSVWWHVFHNGTTWRPLEIFWYDDKWWFHCISRYVVCLPTISNLCLRRQQPGEERQFSRARSGTRRGSGSVQRWVRRLPPWALQSHTAGGGEPRSGSGAPLHAPRASLWDRTGLWTSQATWRRDRGTDIHYYFSVSSIVGWLTYRSFIDAFWSTDIVQRQWYDYEWWMGRDFGSKRN